MSETTDSNSFQQETNCDDQTTESNLSHHSQNGSDLNPNLSARKTGKQKKKKSMNWTLDDQIKLLETRKEMQDVFASKYQTADAWLELVQKCGWNIEWEVARNKFMYLKRREGPKRCSLPPTGISGDFSDGSKKSQIYELASYFTDGSHKYHFPKVIDTSASQDFSANNLEQTTADSVNEGHENHDNNIPGEDFSFLDDRYFEDYNNSDQNAATEKSSQNSTQASSQSSTQSSYQTSNQPAKERSVDSYLYSRKRKRKITQNDIMLKTSDSIEKMANDLSKLTSGTLEYLNFAKEIKLKTYQKKYEMVDLTEEI